MTTPGARRGASGRLGKALVGFVLLATLTACWGASSDSPAAPPGEATATLDEDKVSYLSPDGDDDGPGTLTQPWGTFRHALHKLKPDETLLVRGGSYFEQLTQVAIKDGTRRQRITVRAYPGERPEIHGVVSLWRPAYWTIDGINVTWDPAIKNPPTQMVKVTGGVGWVWQNSEIWGARAAVNMFVTAWDPGEPADWMIAGNCIHDVNPPARVKQGSNLTIGDTGGGSGDVSRNLVFQGPGGRNIVLGSDWRRSSGGAADVTVRYNTVYGADVSITLAGDTSDALIEKNILGSAALGTLVRGSRLGGTGNVVRDNLGMEAARILPTHPRNRLPNPRTLLPGAGNLLTDELSFSDVSKCGGFSSTAAVGLPYGRDALG